MSAVMPSQYEGEFNPTTDGVEIVPKTVCCVADTRHVISCQEKPGSSHKIQSSTRHHHHSHHLANNSSLPQQHATTIQQQQHVNYILIATTF